MQKNTFDITRITHLRELLPKEIEAYLVCEPLDLCYLLNVRVSLGYLLVSRKKIIFFVDSRYFEALKFLDLEVQLLTDNQPIGSHLAEYKTIGFDRSISYAQYEQITKYYPKLKPYDSLVMQLRTIKAPQEIQKIKQAIIHCEKGFSYVQSILKEGVTEIEIAKKVEIFWLENQCDHLSFGPIIAFGKHSAYPHHKPTDQTLKRGDIVLCDMGVVVDGYHSDLARVYGFGTVAQQLQKAYIAVYRALSEAMDSLQQGVCIGLLDQKTKTRIKFQGFDPYGHSLGHGIGLQAHEPPILSQKFLDQKKLLQENMLITIEPGIYLSDLGGIRLEQMVLIEKNGYTLLSSPISEKIPELPFF